MEKKVIGIGPEAKEIMDLIDVHYNVSFVSTRIGNMRMDALRAYPATKVDDFDNYTVAEFLVWYKIDKMVALGNISLEAAALLKSLIVIKKKIESKVGKYEYQKFKNEDKSPDSDEIIVLRDKLEEIYQILESYNLSTAAFNFDDIVSAVVLSEDEVDADIDELKSAVRSIGTLNI